MINLVSLLVATALVSLQCGFAAYAQIDGKNDLDNHLKPNVVPQKRRVVRPFVSIGVPPPETIQLTPGTNLDLSCEVMGHPAPVVQWLKNGEPVTDYEEMNEIINIHPSSLARMTSRIVMASADDGDVFTCVALSGLKRQLASTTVYSNEDEDNMFTLEALFRKPGKPVITDYYNEIFQDLGSAVLLPCRHRSAAPAQVFWLDSNMKPVYGNSRVKILPSGDLLITSLHWEDMGNYTCTVKNVNGKDQIETFLYPSRKQ